MASGISFNVRLKLNSRFQNQETVQKLKNFEQSFFHFLIAQMFYLTYNRRRLHYSFAMFAGSQIFVAVKAFENALKLRRDVFEIEIFFV